LENGLDRHVEDLGGSETSRMQKEAVLGEEEKVPAESGDALFLSAHAQMYSSGKMITATDAAGVIDQALEGDRRRRDHTHPSQIRVEPLKRRHVLRHERDEERLGVTRLVGIAWITSPRSRSRRRTTRSRRRVPGSASAWRPRRASHVPLLPKHFCAGTPRAEAAPREGRERPTATPCRHLRVTC
jgi:hypothetical protein